MRRENRIRLSVPYRTWLTGVIALRMPRLLGVYRTCTPVELTFTAIRALFSMVLVCVAYPWAYHLH